MPQEPEGSLVFISYAHQDERLRKRLDTHLALMQRQGVIQTWHNRQIRAGTDWAKTIDTQLEEASIILLLISANFVASDYCYGLEMKRALERHEARQAMVIPIMLRPVDWNTAPFAHLQALPTNGKAITRWKNRDEAFTEVAKELCKAIEATLISMQWSKEDKQKAVHRWLRYLSGKICAEYSIIAEPDRAREPKADSILIRVDLSQNRLILHSGLYTYVVICANVGSYTLSVKAQQ